MAIASNTLQKNIQRGPLSNWIFKVLKWNIPEDRAERIHEKIGAIFLVMKCLKSLIFCIFCWDQQNFCHSLGNIFKYTCTDVTFIFEHFPSRTSKIGHFKIFSHPRENQLTRRFFVKFNLLLFFLIS